MKRAFSLSLMFVIGTILFYISRFWPFSFWDRPGLFGWGQLPPNGGLLRRWLRGTDFTAYELLIWIVLVFLCLTAVQKFSDRFIRP
ncbi:MAG: hypothetical protein QNJ29_03205 [Rhizobiaceae bacterium]|nr:hypothetical protein [Rhizobiaceae bacterium]